jgi:hypothetical protein
VHVVAFKVKNWLARHYYSLWEEKCLTASGESLKEKELMGKVDLNMALGHSRRFHLEKT